MNEHDKFFKEVFSRKEEVADFVHGTFPPEIAAKIDYDSLCIDNTDYISLEMKEFYSDVVYNCLYNRDIPIKIGLLFEHKSYVPQYPHLQLLRYILCIWETQIKQDPPQPIMPVIPIVVYHGEGKWTKKEFHNYFTDYPAELLAFLPQFDYLLADLSGTTNEKIKQQYHSLIMQMSLLLMKNIFDSNFITKIATIFERLNELLNKKQNKDFFIQIVYYVLKTVEPNAQTIKKEIEKISLKGGKLAMTAAQRLIQEGRQEGRQEGVQIGEQIGMLINKFDIGMLVHKKGFSKEQIMEITKLTCQQVDYLIDIINKHGYDSLDIIRKDLESKLWH